MKKLYILVLLLAFNITAVSAEKMTFSDIKGHWAEKTIENMANKGIISGYPDGSFLPDEPITRAELAKIMTTAFDLTENVSLEQYQDLDSAEWYYPYVEKAAKYIPNYCLTTLYPSNQIYENNSKSFLPDVPALRAHTAEALSELKIDKENLDVDIPDIIIMYSDLCEKLEPPEPEGMISMHGQIPSNWSRPVKYQWLALEFGIMQGDSEGHFNPYGYLTRAELATIAERMMK